MAYQVIARKWRPQTFDEVVFQEHVSKTLRNSLKSGRISHAYLFSGPRGVGKTTLARILAKSVNCKGETEDAPCGVCENCLEITRGVSFDVIEIDGASNNGVDDIRELRENVNFAPVKSKYKVYIIDEVHMVTQAAFNALLKTLEEPPPHIVFIFATTEYRKIPETILSRCQKFFFKKIPVADIVSHLRRIAEAEGYNISDNALYSIARSTDGAMRDAQSLLEQAVSFSQHGEIDNSDVLTILGLLPFESYNALFQAIAEENPSLLFEEIEKIYDMGADIPRYAEGLSEILRALRLIKNGIPVKSLLALSDDEEKLFSKTAGFFSDEELSRMFRVASELQSDMRYSANAGISLEMALLDMLRIKQIPSLSAILQKMEATGETPPLEPLLKIPVQPVQTQPAQTEPQAEPEAAGLFRQGRELPREETLHKEGSEAATIEKIKDTFLGEILKPKGE
ncbi:MAG: DNA polymerase III subunit gamma/tau [Leptospirales bacterium]|nr:DNA polymerase III subunit gamma/tau [Leptospirales bacterium]